MAIAALVAVLIFGPTLHTRATVTSTAGVADLVVDTNPGKTHTPAKLGDMTPAQKRKFRAFVRLLALRAYLDWLWHFTHEPYDWYAIAQCETGGNWNVTGPRYSTGLGMMNQAIRENSPPEVAARELAGTATVVEIVLTAREIARKHGIHSWGCGKALYP